MIWNQEDIFETPAVETAAGSENGQGGGEVSGGEGNAPGGSGETSGGADEESRGEASGDEDEESREEAGGNADEENRGEAGGNADEENRGEAGGNADEESREEAEGNADEENREETGGNSDEEYGTETDGSGSYIIGEDGGTQIVFDAEPETEYIVGTPVNTTADVSSGKDSGGFISKTYSGAAGMIAKTAESAAKSAAPALKTIGFNLVNAVLILFIGIQIAKLCRKMLNRTFERIHMDSSLRSFLTSIIYALICGVAAFMAMERVGISSASIIALLGSAGLAVSLSLQDFLGNFAGGVIILILKPFRAGDYIVCGSAEGTVASTSLFYTTLNTIDNRQMILPNGALSNANIINVTAEEKRRLEIRVDISYESDLRRAKEILARLYDEQPDILHEEDVLVFVDSLGESGITLVARGWIATDKYWPAKWELTEKVKYAFDEAGIVIPYRQVVVHTGVSGKKEEKEET